MGEPLRIEVGAPTGVQISPDLWGIFFEDINTCLDGGINAELVRNGDFEFTELDHEGWGPLEGWEVSGEGSARILAQDPVHPNNRHYLRLVGPVRIVNDGWDGVLAGGGVTHRFSVATWLVRGEGEVRVAVVPQDDHDGDALATASFSPPARGWHWNHADLASSGAPTRGHLALDVPNGVTLEVDVLSLRPLGADGEPLTFRPDLVEALRGLTPSFVRFPGGCVAHGLGLANMYHWKPSVGPRHTREHLVNTWGYHQTRQIGYLEYFELCEELGATALPVLAAGVCCQNLRGRASAIPESEMPAYVQDVLDLVEFANGGPETTWGAYRAELGHPEPFGLRYLGIGNEDEITEDFRVRYAQIEDAVNAAHPGVSVVGTVGPNPFGEDFEAGWAFARERGVALVDEHAYRTPRWYHQNTDRYDGYDRSGPAVYFGEYAARTNRVRSALAEAAFMIGMERNGDVVRLASYAPLLARIGATQWVPDLIYFDAERVLPSASYHVQAAFGRERGVDARTVALTGGPDVEHGLVRAQPSHASARLHSRGARIEIGSLTLDGHPLPDVCTEPDGELTALGETSPMRSVLEFTACRVSGTEGLVIALGGEGDDSHVEIGLGSWENKATVVTGHDDGISCDIDGPFLWRGMRTAEHLAVRVEREGARVRVWLDGELRHDVEIDERPERRVVAGAATRMAADGALEYVVRMVNASDVDRTAEVSLGVAGDVTGTLTLIAGAGPDAGEPFEPSPVSPREWAITGRRGTVSIDLPAWGFASAVMRAG